MQRNLNRLEYQCGLCEMRKKENLIRVLFHCPKLDNMRTKVWGRLLSSMPPGMMQDMCMSERTLTILMSGLGGTYVREWDIVYANIALFVWRMYRHRKEMYDEMMVIPTQSG